MDPYAVLGLDPGATVEEATAAYRDLAKQLHPDVAGGEAGHIGMARLNAAYDAIRAGEEAADGNGSSRSRPAPGDLRDDDAPARPGYGSWLSDRIRAALEPQILVALERFEDVRLVARVSTWESPDTQLVVTDRRLLWIGLWEISPRVSSLPFADVEDAAIRVRRPLRRRAVVRLTTRTGARQEFGDLEPESASLVVRNVLDGAS